MVLERGDSATHAATCYHERHYSLRDGVDIQRSGRAMQVADGQATNAWTFDHHQRHRVLRGGVRMFSMHGPRNYCDGL